MDSFQLTSPEESVAIASAAVLKIRESLAETRDKGVIGGIGFDQLGDATDILAQLVDLAEGYGCLVMGPFDSEEENGGGYYLFERRDAPNVVDGGWLTRAEPERGDEFPSYRGMA